MEEQVGRYERFIDEVLRSELRRLAERLAHVHSEIADLAQQQHTLRILTDEERHGHGFKTQVNVGCDFFVEGHVRDTSCVLLHVGLQHYVELSPRETARHLEVRQRALETLAEQLRTRAAHTRAHIKLMLLGVDQLRAGAGAQPS